MLISTMLYFNCRKEYISLFEKGKPCLNKGVGRLSQTATDPAKSLSINEIDKGEDGQSYRALGVLEGSQLPIGKGLFCNW